MKKTNFLLGGALLLVALFTTSCDKLMSKLDNPVNSYLEMNNKDVALWVGQKVSYPATSISTESIVYSSSDPDVVTVDDQGNIEAVGVGSAKISAFVKSNGEYQEGNVSYNVEVKQFNLGEQYTEALAKATGNVVEIAIPANVKAVMTSKIKTTAGIKLVVKSADKNAPATIYTKGLSENNMFEINSSIVLQDLKIDASELASKSMITTGTIPGASKTNNDLYFSEEFAAKVKEFEKTTVTQLAATAYILDEITVENCMIKGVNVNLVWNGSTVWAVEKLNLKDNIIQLDNAIYTFIRLHAVKDLTVTGNTVYNLKETGVKNEKGDLGDTYFFRQSNASNAAKYYGINYKPNDNASLNWVVENNTFIRTFTGKDFANNVTNNKAVTITLKNNVLYDVYRFNKIVGGNMVKVYDKATNFIYGEKVTVDNTDKGTYCTLLTAAPFEAPTEALDLTKENGGLNLKPSGATTGDPRWLK